MAFTATIAEVIAGDRTGLLAKHASWERVPLSEVASILNGAPFDSSLFSTSHGFPLIRIRDVISGSTSTFYTGPIDETYIVNAGEILVGMDGDFNTGFWGPVPALLNQRVCKITPNEIFYSKKLLSYVLPGYLAAINAATPSITVKHLSSKTIAEIELPLPPHAEQTRIVEKLEELLSDLDAGVAELKAAQAKLVRYRQSLLKAAVEGALTAEWRQHNTPEETGAQLLQRILTERRARWEAKQLAKFAEQGKAPPEDWQKKYPEPMQPDTRDLPELPEGWIWASVDQLSPDDIANGRSVPTSALGAKVLRLTAIKSGRIDQTEFKIGAWSEAEAQQFSIVQGDLLIARGNGSLNLVGRAGIVGIVLDQIAYPDTMIRLRVIDSVVSASWINLAWESKFVRTHLEQRARTSAGIYKISQPDIVSAPIPVGPLEEQAEIVGLIEHTFDHVDVLQKYLHASSRLSTAQRKNILRAAFSGQLVPQDPNDEPASALLARIRAQREADAGASASKRGRKTKGAA